jgi:cytosine/adenosine deaminase-related metal-dependent hydrolase
MAPETPMKEELLGRWLVSPEGLKEGYIRLAQGRIEEVCVGPAPRESIKAVILPSLVNSHVHIGDSVAYPAPKGTVKEVVGPPHGYKHKVLKATSDGEKIAAMKRALGIMSDSGTALFGDFREEGRPGIRSLRSALEGTPVDVRVFGRPESPDPKDAELEDLLAESDGIGMSALADWPYDLLRRLSKKAKASDKLFAMHASETDREDIDLILDLKPDFLVHMCKATEGDLEACAKAHVPIVVCPRSNEFFHMDPGIPRLLKAGVTVAIGTDNGMIVRPDLIEEMKASFRMSIAGQGVSPHDIVHLATSNGRKVLNAEPKITTEIGAQSDLVAVRVKGDNPLLELVTETSSVDVVGKAQGGRFRRTAAWTR